MAIKLSDRSPLRLANVVLSIQTFATLKNDISLFPFATGTDGVARISRDEMRAEASATYDSGLMDYAPLESAYEMIEIRLSSVSEIERALTSRTQAWASLLKGEEKRWRSIDELVAVLRAAANCQLTIPEELAIRPRIRDAWSDPDVEKSYEMFVRKKG